MRSEVKQECTEELGSRDIPCLPVYTSTSWFYSSPVILLLSIVELENVRSVVTHKMYVFEQSNQGGFFNQKCVISLCRKGWWELQQSDPPVLNSTDDVNLLHLFTLHVTIFNCYPGWTLNEQSRYWLYSHTCIYLIMVTLRNLLITNTKLRQPGAHKCTV